MGAKRKIFIPLAITVILLIAFVAAWAGISQNDYVFKINGQKVSMNEFSPYLKIQKKTMEAELGEDVWDRLINEAPAIESARNSAKQSLVEDVIKVQQAKARKISLTKEEIEAIRLMAEQEAVVERLEPFGITKEEFIKMNEDVLLIDKLKVALYKETDHTDHSHGKVDMMAYENGSEPSNVMTFNSRHILFSTKNLTAEQEVAVKAKAEDVLNRIKNGEDFATLAGQYSEDPGSKANGGLYENIGSGAFVWEYEKAIRSINAGEVYPELVKSSHGYHIIKSEGVTNPDGYVSNDAVENILLGELYDTADKWLAEAVVEVNEQRYNSAQ